MKNFKHSFSFAHGTKSALVLSIRAVVSWTASKQPVNASAHNIAGNELGSQQETVQRQQTMQQWGIASNGISGLLQMCQLKRELCVMYANEGENLLAQPSLPMYSIAPCYSDTPPCGCCSSLYDKLWFMDYWFHPNKLIQYISLWAKMKNALLSVQTQCPPSTPPQEVILRSLCSINVSYYKD